MSGQNANLIKKNIVKLNYALNIKQIFLLLIYIKYSVP